MTGDLLANDEVPASLYPILKRQMNEQLPVLLDSAHALGEWAMAQPKGARIKRSLGAHEFTIGGRRGERNIIVLLALSACSGCSTSTRGCPIRIASGRTVSSMRSAAGR